VGHSSPIECALAAAVGGKAADILEADYRAKKDDDLIAIF
jgi:hypothetical protein